MPIYEYQCERGHLKECFASTVSPATIVCPQCGGVSKRLMSVPAPPRMGRIYDSQNPPDVKREWDNRFGIGNKL